MARISLGDYSLNVEVHEQRVPMDTLFIHGNLASNNWWQPSLEVWRQMATSKLEGRTICAEWRGCGKSDPPHDGTDLNMERLASDYVNLLRQLGVKKTCVVGHSTGGLIALICLRQAPELFHRAVLLDPVSATGAQLNEDLMSAFKKMSQDRDLCAQVMSGTIHNVDSQGPQFQKIVDDAFGVAKENWLGIPKALGRIDILGDLHHIRQPVLVCHGEHDTLLPIEGSVTMAEHLANGRFIELKGQGHSTNVENPKLFVSLVHEFLFE